jgi:hypothetical protein
MIQSDLEFWNLMPNVRSASVHSLRAAYSSKTCLPLVLAGLQSE